MMVTLFDRSNKITHDTCQVKMSKNIAIPKNVEQTVLAFGGIEMSRKFLCEVPVFFTKLFFVNKGSDKHICKTTRKIRALS